MIAKYIIVILLLQHLLLLLLFRKMTTPQDPDRHTMTTPQDPDLHMMTTTMTGTGTITSHIDLDPKALDLDFHTDSLNIYTTC